MYYINHYCTYKHSIRVERLPPPMLHRFVLFKYENSAQLVVTMNFLQYGMFGTTFFLFKVFKT